MQKPASLPLTDAGKKARAVRIVLAAVFLAGAVLITAGLQGLRAYNTSGFSSEAGFQAVYAL